MSLAGGGLKLPITSDTNVLDSSASGAYPIASTTYVVIYSNQTSQDVAQTLVDFFTWGLTTGQADASKLSYAPLPDTVAQQALQELSKLTLNGKAVTASSNIG